MITLIRRQSTPADRRRISRAHDLVMRRLEADTERTVRAFWRAAGRDIIQRLESLSSIPETPDEIWRPDDWRVEFIRRMRPRWNASIWSGVDFEFEYVRTANPSVIEQSAAWNDWMVRQETVGVDLDELAATPPPDIRVDPSNRLMGEIRSTLKAREVGVWGHVNKTTHDKLRLAIQKGLKEGDDLSALTTRVQGTLKGYSRAQAKRIARTETTLVMNSGQHAERNELDIPAKEWVSTLDARNRGADPRSIFDHLRPDGQITAQDQPFQVSGELLRYPGDSSLGASAGNTINCRCSSVASWDRPTVGIIPPPPKPKPKAKPKPKPKPKKTPAPKPARPDSGLPDAPSNGMTFTGTATDFSRKVWKEIGDGLTDEAHARRVGKVIREEIWTDSKITDLGQEMTESIAKKKASDEKLLAKLERRLKKAKDSGTRALTADDIRKLKRDMPDNLRAVRESYQAQIHSRANQLLEEKMRQIRDMGPRNKTIPYRFDKPSDTIYNRKAGYKSPPNIHDDLADSIDRAQKQIPTDFLDDIHDTGNEYVVAHSDRGYSRHTASSKHIVTSGRNVDQYARTLVHEITHEIENSARTRQARKSFVELEREFYERRTAGLPRTEIYKGSGEFGIEDDFLQHYIGRWYNGNHFEVTTMGWDSIMGGPASDLARAAWKDPDFVDFVIGLMAGF